MNRDLLSSGENEELLNAGVNAWDDEDLDDENLFGKDDDDSEDHDDEEADDDEEQQQNQKPNKNIDRKKKYHADLTRANTRISQLEKDQRQLDKAKEDELSDEDLALLREKYDENDLAVIQKLIKKEARQLINNDKETTLYQKELRIFVNKHPELEEWELKYIQDMQEKYWFSLEKAYRMAFGGSQQTTKKWHSNGVVTNVDSGSKRSKAKDDDGDDAAYNDMLKNYT